MSNLFFFAGNDAARADVVSPTVTELGTSTGTESDAGSVADNGATVGWFTANSTAPLKAYRWTQAGGMVFLGTLGGSTSNSDGISADGNVAVGYSTLAGDTAYRAFRWTQASGMVDLGTFGGTNSFAWELSADGSVVVGDSYLTGNSADHAYRWTQGTGMVDLGTLGGTNSNAWGVSADGNVATGFSQIAGNGAYHAFRWTQGTGMADLGTLGGTNSYGFAISADGTTVAGYADIIGGTEHAFRWTQATGMADLGTLGGSNSIVQYGNSVSSDGGIIVGDSQITGSSTYHAFRWTQTTGMQDLNTLLSNAGVNMSGVTLNNAQGISPNGKYIVGQGAFPDSAVEAFLVCYDPASGCVGMTTGASQQASTQQLADNAHANMLESHATANEILGMTRPVDTSDYMQAGGMFGSAVGYTSGQYSARGVTVLGGLAYGAQDYPNIGQSDAPTVAAAARYTFDDPFGDAGQALHPYAEIGGWVTPQANLTLTRNYANGAGSNTGVGSTQETSWAEYGRGGLVWNLPYDQFTGYGELGQQSLSYAGYSETQNLSNPFPASVDGSVLRLNIARVGTAWTHWLDPDLLDSLFAIRVPVSFTLAGDMARSFASTTTMTATVAGIGTMQASSPDTTWGEFGARVETQFTDHLALDLDLNGTSGGGAMGTALHGGAGVSYKF